MSFEFEGKAFSFAPGSWVFVALPKTLSIKIRSKFQKHEEGWGRLKCIAKVKDSFWRTSVWYDSKLKTYLLPLKKEIRKKENIEIDQKVKFEISFDFEIASKKNNLENCVNCNRRFKCEKNENCWCMKKPLQTKIESLKFGGENKCFCEDCFGLLT